MEDDRLFEVQIISPDRVFYTGRVSFLELSTTEGRIGIYKKHVPTTCILTSGIVSMQEESEIKKAAVHSGFAEILQDKVTIMAEVAEWPDEIDLNRANEAKVRAERRLASQGSEVNLERAEIALKKALTRISLKN